MMERRLAASVRKHSVEPVSLCYMTCIHLELFPIQELFLFSFPQANRTRMQAKTAVQEKQFN